MSKRGKGPRRASRGRRGRLPGLWTLAVVAGAVVIAILALRGAGVFEPAAANVDLNASAYRVAPGETVGTKVESQGGGHMPEGQHFAYNTTPPTSGSHWQSPATWGIKDTQEPNERTTHNLEHGGIVIAYSPSLAAEDLTKLKSLVRGVSGTYRKVLLEPYPQLNDAKIAVTAWIWILKLPEFDETQIVKFIRAHYQSSDAPEPNVP